MQGICSFLKNGDLKSLCPENEQVKIEISDLGRLVNSLIFKSMIIKTRYLRLFEEALNITTLLQRMII